MDAAWVKTQIDENQALADKLGISGTPSFVVGKTLIPGAVDVGRARREGGRTERSRATSRQRLRASVSPSPSGSSTGLTRGSAWILRVELADHQRLPVAIARIGDPAAPEHVVERHDAARADQRQRSLVIGVVELLVGVDIGEVERCPLRRFASSASKVSRARPRRSSIRSATPAARQCRRPISA